MKIWMPNTDDLFTVKSCSNMMDWLLYDGAQPFQSLVWRKYAPPKVQLFLWLIVQDKVSIGDLHDFLTLYDSRCVYVIKAWNLQFISLSITILLVLYEWNSFHDEVLAVFFQNLLMICSINGFLWWKANNRISHDNFSSLVLCEIWLYRNDVIFNGVTPNL